MRPRSMLHTYQREAVVKIKTNLSSALWMEVGTGKTITTLTAIEELMDECHVYGTLVISTKRIVEAVWRQEAKEWEHTTDFSFSLISGTPAQRLRQLFRRADIYLINYENIPWLIDALIQFWLSRGKHLPFNMIVLDEVSKMANATSQRVKAFCKIYPYVARKVGLTGTPATNGLVKLHGQYLVLDGGVRLGRSKTKFISKYFETDYMGYSLSLREGAKEAIRAEIQDMTYIAAASDHLDLPALTVVDINIQWEKQGRDIYDEMETEFFIQLSDGSVEAFNQTSKSTKLLQICSGFVYTEEPRQTLHVHNQKLDALAELIEELDGTPLLVCNGFIADADRIKARFPTAVSIKDDSADVIVARWNRGEIPILVGHPASMGHGLNLQHGGNHLAWFSLTWDLEYYEQAIGRLMRQGQTKPVFVHRLLMDNSMDNVVIEALSAKGNTQAAIKNAIKHYQENK